MAETKPRRHELAEDVGSATSSHTSPTHRILEPVTRNESADFLGRIQPH